MEAIILAGGFGTRLAGVISNKPKVMASVNDTPFLSYVLNALQKGGISSVILALGWWSTPHWRCSSIASTGGRSTRWGLRWRHCG